MAEPETPSNVDLFRRGMDALARGDVEANIAQAADDVVLWARRSAVAGEYVGHDGVRKLHADNAELFEVWRVDYPDVRDLGDGRVLALGAVHIQVKGGGAEADAPSGGVATFEDGKLKSWHDYGDHDEALAAAGLAD